MKGISRKISKAFSIVGKLGRQEILNATLDCVVDFVVDMVHRSIISKQALDYV